MRSFEREVAETYGFVLDLSTSTHLNARCVLGDTLPWIYFCHATNMAFHDLTDGKSIPYAASSVLGLGLKFIPTPPYSSGVPTVDIAFNHLKRDIGLKVWFVAEEDKIMEPTMLECYVVA